MHFGLTVKALAELAYDYAKKLGKKLPSGWEANKAAGNEWCLAFRRRNGLSLRTPENTSIARSQAFKPTNVQRFHEALSDALVKHDFGPCSVWNLDETGITTVTKAPKLLSPTGTRQVGATASAERGVLITVCACVSAAGRALPPVLLYPRKRVQPHWATDAPPGSLILANDSGWMDKETFPKALTHFISHMSASEQNPQLLIFDNHCSHVTLQVINIAREHGVAIVTLPAHCSHRMQPLDVSVMAPFKTFYSEEINAWHHRNPGRTISIHELAAPVNKAFTRAFSMVNITAGFAKSSVWPPNPAGFTDVDFLAALPSPVPAPTGETSETEGTVPRSPEPGSSTSMAVTPQEIRPFPVAPPPRMRGSGRGRGKRLPVVLTSTPEKSKLEQATSARARRNAKEIRLDDEEQQAVTSDSDADIDPVEMEEERIGLLSDPMVTEFSPVQIKTGDFLLVAVRGAGRRGTVTYRYVVQALEPFDEDDPDWIRVHGYQSLNSARTRFEQKPNDVFAVDLDDVIGGLQVPQISSGRGLAYLFPGTVDVKEF